MGTSNARSTRAGIRLRMEGERQGRRLVTMARRSSNPKNADRACCTGRIENEGASVLINPTSREIQIGPCRLINADCLEVLPMLTGVDAIISDPPYGIGYVRGRGGKQAGYRGKVSAEDSGNYEPIVGDDKPFDPLHLLS